MPLRVRIDVNGKDLSTIHISRVSRNVDMSPGVVNVYRAVVKNDGYPSYVEWDDGVVFEHCYGDGAEVCVAKAITVLKSQGLL